MKKSTRALSLLLVLVMVVALMPTFTLEAKADGAFYGGGATAGSATNVTWYGKETLKDSNNNDVKIMQYANTAYSGEPINRHTLNTGDNINMDIPYEPHGNRFVFLIPYNSGTIYLDKNNNNANNPIGKHLVNGERASNRWWRWHEWGNNSTKWTDSNDTAGFFARVKGTGSNWHDVSKNPNTNFSWNSYWWTGGNDSTTGNNLDIKINSNGLSVGNKGVMWNANGTELTDRGNRIKVEQQNIQDCWMDNGSIGVSEFIIAEPKEVVYELNGGTLNGQTGGNIGYICWNTNDKVTSQLHDIIGEPTRDDGYDFVGWECVSTEGTTVANAKVTKEHVVTGNIKNNNGQKTGYDKYNVTNEGSVIEKGKVYQTKDQNDNATTLTVLGNVVFRAKWVKATSKIAHVQNNAIKSTEDLKLADFGSYKVVAFDKEKEFASNSAKLDLTTKVSEGYLYGGTFKDDYATVADFNGGTANSFVPKFTEKGETYCIWEVSDQHIQPTVLNTYSKTNGTYKVEDAFLITAVDRTLYQEAGFVVNGTPMKSQDLEKVNNALYEKIAVKAEKTGTTTEMNYARINPLYKDAAKAKLACVKITVPSQTPATVVPYWVTLDGQTIYGIKQAKVSYIGEGSAIENGRLTVSYYDSSMIVKSAAAPARSFAAAPMMLMATYSMDQDPNPAEIPEPPVEPDTPDEPDVPVVPDEPETPAVLNVVDGNKTYTVELGVEEVALTPAGQDGMYFAGWYADKACTVPTDLSKAEDGNTVYAKYISDSYLQVKYNAVFTLLSKSVSLTSAVDSKDYAETGYVISTKNGDDKVVVSKYATTFAFQNAKQLFGVEKNAPLMNVDYKLSGLSKNDTVTVIPYLVTADGTTVYGTARMLTYTGLTMKG